MLRVATKAARKIGFFFSKGNKKKESPSEKWVTVKKIRTKNQRRIQSRKRKIRKRIKNSRRKKSRRR